tara:strand:- start:59 stop:397 length:339 start_codon:yes stop_codon:yes gene_type:complete
LKDKDFDEYEKDYLKRYEEERKKREVEDEIRITKNRGTDSSNNCKTCGRVLEEDEIFCKICGKWRGEKSKPDDTGGTGTKIAGGLLAVVILGGGFLVLGLITGAILAIIDNS